MSETITRKCQDCKKEIVVDRDNIDGIIFFKKYYYHEDCFRALATKRASQSRSSPDWKKALDDNLIHLKKETMDALNYWIGRDDLFTHLLDNYNINSVSSYVSKTVDQIIQGTYKGKSNPIPYRDFATCWIESQKGLDKIAMKNERIGKKMTGDQRINYDMAIMVRRYPEWKKEKAKIEQNKKEVISSVVFDELDMSRIGQGKQIKRRDISDIADDIFVE